MAPSGGPRHAARALPGAAGLIDDLCFAVSAVVLGQGEAIFAGIDLPALVYRVTAHQATDQATHIVLAR